MASWEPLPRRRTHEQVINEIENRLATGDLRVGDRLPPERQFAELLGVSRVAVREALRILEAVGVLQATVGSGPTSGSVIVGDAGTGIALVLRLHLPAASFGADDLAAVQRSLRGLTGNPLAAALTAELPPAQEPVSGLRPAG